MTLVAATLSCREEDCVKNHIEHYEVVDDATGTVTPMARIHLVHHKNGRRDGTAVLPVGGLLVEALALLERAAKVLAPDCPTIFFRWGNLQPYGMTHFPLACSKALAIGQHHCTATDMRHEFSTAWRDWEASKAGISQGPQQLEAAAATMMGNRPCSWNATYDDSAAGRPLQQVMAVYMEFCTWVEARHKNKRVQRERDPLLPMA